MRARYLGPNHKCSHCGTLFKKRESITVDGSSGLVFCRSVQVGDCLQQYLLFHRVKNGDIFCVTMIYNGDLGETMPNWMERLSGFFGGRIAR